MRTTEKQIIEKDVEKIWCDNCGIQLHTVWSCWACEKEYCEKCAKKKLKEYSTYMRLCKGCEPDFKEDIIKYDKLSTFRRASREAENEALEKLHEKNIARRKNE